MSSEKREGERKSEKEKEKERKRRRDGINEEKSLFLSFFIQIGGDALWDKTRWF